MNAPRVCTNCGYDLAIDAPVLINDFAMAGPGFPLVYKGKPLKLTFAEATICWSLIKSCPVPLRTSVLAERMGTDESLNPDNGVKVLVCRIRKRLRNLGISSPIMTIYGSHTYVWDPRA